MSTPEIDIDALVTDVNTKGDGDLSNLSEKGIARIRELADTSITIFDLLYPVGAIYIGTQETCPLATLGVGTWSLVSSGRVLQGSDSTHAAGSTIAAGVPNITGSVSTNSTTYPITNGANPASGALSCSARSISNYYPTTKNSATRPVGFGFNASSSNSIYGNSSTVQPPAYAVNIWERIE